jgi:glycerate kinase
MLVTTTGVGELITHAVAAGARRIIVGLGGSATTDGGLGAVRAIGTPARLAGVELLVACDVATRFVDAAPVFAPQKGASPAQVDLLRNRLERLVQDYRDEFGVDVADLPGAGAAGGLAGGLAALGGRIVGGFDLVADELDLHDTIASADLVITGEGHLDAQSFDGKVVGGVAAIAAEHGVPVVVICGVADDEVVDRLPTRQLVEICGREDALTRPIASITRVATDAIRSLAGG